MAKRFTSNRKFVTFCVLSVLLTALNLLRYTPQAVERYYAQGIYPVVSAILQAVFNVVPFSVGDLIYVCLIVMLLYSLFKILRSLLKKQFRQAGKIVLNTVITTQVLVLIFYLFWGINYFRQPVTVRLHIPDSTYTTNELVHLTRELIDSANACRKRLSYSDLHQTNEAIFAGSALAVTDLHRQLPQFSNPRARIKSSSLSWYLNYATTAGYYTPFTAEAQLNRYMPVYLKPVVACHEMSHQSGFNAEDEANFAGFLAGVNAPNRLLNYSAYYLGTQEFMREIWRRDTVVYHALRGKISKRVLADFKYERAYWLKYQGRIDALTGIFYDNYLKANKQPEGLRSYNLMVRLVMGYYRKNGWLKTPE